MRRVYRVPSFALPSLVHALAHWYGIQALDARIVHLSEERALLHVRQPEPWAAELGVSSVLQVFLCRDDRRLEVRVWVDRWVDRKRAGDLGAFFFWSLLFTAAWRVWHRERWPERTFAFIERYLATVAPEATAPRR